MEDFVIRIKLSKDLKRALRSSLFFRELNRAIMQKGVIVMFIRNINALVEGMLEDKQLRILWFGILVFGIVSTWLAWKYLPLTFFEALLDPLAVGYMLFKTIEHYRKK